MKKQIKTPEKDLRNVEIANLSGVEFKTLVTRMLTELIKFGHKMKEEMKAIQREIKENIQGTNSEGKETGTQRFGTKGRNKYLTGTDETRIQKSEERLRNFWDNFKHPTSKSQGCQKERRKSKKWKT